MYIKNQTFTDEETLLEILFDFSLGTPSETTTEMASSINKELQNNEAYTNYFNSLTNEDDRLELQAEESSIRLAEKLMQQFDSFEVNNCKLYGIMAGKKTLLYEIDLY